MHPRHGLLRPVLAFATLGWAIVAPAVVAEAQTPKRGGTLRVSYGNEISALDFHTAPGYELNWVAMNIGCGLLGITPDGRFVPDAALEHHLRLAVLRGRATVDEGRRLSGWTSEESR